ncbi:ricin-type beta-trefoil lectin domain protein [Actinoplanes sp. NPDC049548]|uniref:ricin-type beta-trefoil lectin domain protein n=1 Tax=Actinoplanes sp. NPDC049548 TaxID=3155152 RepID=UPI00342DDFB2
MTGPMWAVLAAATLILAGGLTAAVRGVRRGRAARWWPAPARPTPTLAHQWASQELAPRSGRHVRSGRAGRVLIVAACAIALVAVGSVATLALTGKPPAERFAVALSGQPAGDVAYGPRIVSEDAALCLAARSVADGSTLTVAACDGTPAQRWTPAADGTLRIGASCLAATTSAGPRLAACDSGPGQRFSLDSGRLVWRGSPPPLTCVDVADGRVVAAAGIVLRDCDRAATRHWWYLAS